MITSEPPGKGQPLHLSVKVFGSFWVLWWQKDG